MNTHQKERIVSAHQKKAAKLQGVYAAVGLAAVVTAFLVVVAVGWVSRYVGTWIGVFPMTWPECGLVGCDTVIYHGPETLWGCFGWGALSLAALFAAAAVGFVILMLVYNILLNIGRFVAAVWQHRKAGA